MLPKSRSVLIKNPVHFRSQSKDQDQSPVPQEKEKVRMWVDSPINNACSGGVVSRPATGSRAPSPTLHCRLSRCISKGIPLGPQESRDSDLWLSLDMLGSRTFLSVWHKCWLAEAKSPPTCQKKKVAVCAANLGRPWTNMIQLQRGRLWTKNKKIADCSTVAESTGTLPISSQKKKGKTTT